MDHSVAQYVEIYSSESFPCDMCEKIYRSKSALKKHLHYHGEKTEMCDTCGKKFYTKGDLWQHKKLLDYNPVVCEYCGKVYKSKGALEFHKTAKHEQLKMKKCKLCPKEFCDNFHKSRHEKTHSQLKSVCDKCGNFFRNLEEHIITCRNTHRKNPINVNFVMPNFWKSAT